MEFGILEIILCIMAIVTGHILGRLFCYYILRMK